MIYSQTVLRDHLLQMLHGSAFLRRCFPTVSRADVKLRTLSNQYKTTSFPGVQESVKEYYGKILSSSKDLKTNACTASGAPSPLIRKSLLKVPNEVRFFKY